MDTSQKIQAYPWEIEIHNKEKSSESLSVCLQPTTNNSQRRSIGIGCRKEAARL
jgi:hypothetical protein